MSKISPISSSQGLRTASLSRSRAAKVNPPCEGYGEPAEPSVEQRVGEMEARLAVLESAILEHAMVLRDRIGQRLDRLEQKFRYEADGIRRALQDESKDRNAKIIQLTESFTNAVDRVESRQGVPGGDVGATLQDLIVALAATRMHLDVLAQAVADKQDDGLAS